jgi:uncharacterized OB-fold protein
MKKIVARVVCFLDGHSYLPGSRYCWRCHRGERVVEPVTRVTL